MDSIINEASFIHNDVEIAQAFQLKVQSWRLNNKDRIYAHHIINGYLALSEKALMNNCPKKGTAGWKQASDAFQTLGELIVSLLAPSTEAQSQCIPEVTNAVLNMGLQIVTGITNLHEFHELFYRLMVDWFQAGPSTLSIGCTLSLLKHKRLAVQTYTKTLKDEKLFKLLKAIASPLVNTEDTKDFYSAYNTCLEHLFNSLHRSEQLTETNTKLMLELAFDLYLNYTTRSEDCLKELERTAKTVFEVYSRTWETFSDVPSFKSYIQRFSDVFKTPGFPRTKAIADLIQNALTKLIKRLQVIGQVEIFAPDLFDLMETLAEARGDIKQILDIFKVIVEFFNHHRKKKDDPTIFKVVAPRFASMVSNIDLVYVEYTRFVPIITTMLANAYADNRELSDMLFTMALPLLKRETPTTWEECRWVLSKGDHINWKEYQQFADEFLEFIASMEVPLGDCRRPCVSTIKSCARSIIHGLKKARIMKNYGVRLMHLSVHLLELRPWSEPMFEAAEGIGGNIEIDVKENKDAIMKVMHRLHAIIQDPELPWPKVWVLRRAVCIVIRNITDCVKDANVFSDEDFNVFKTMCLTCLNKDPLEANRESVSDYFYLAERLMESLIPWLGAVKKVSFAKECIPFLLNLIDDEPTRLRELTLPHVREFSNQDASVLAPFFDEIIRIYLSREISDLLHILYEIYETPRVSLKHHIQVILTKLFEVNLKSNKGGILRLLHEASKKEPELFTEDNIKDLIHFAESDKENQPTCLQILTGVCKRRPGKLIKHLDQLMKIHWEPMYMAMLNDILCTVGLYDKNVAVKIVDFISTTFKSATENYILVTGMNAIRLIGFKNPDILKPKRDFFAKLYLIDGNANAMRQLILDMIDGKTPEDVKRQLEAQQETVTELVDRVDEVEGTVAAVVGELEEQRQDLDNVKNDVTEQSQRLDQVEEVVDDTVKKVEEIDNKTLSHAPYWSRDISKLLNPASEHDWRLLSSRLGYSKADVRGWAQQADPCMAMLNEWYATRKTSEATNAILDHLQEMNREDAALIVENAMKKAEAVVEDEEFEFASPPEIFISYQWGHQEEVKLLHRHLTMAGYNCWMDIGQMGGGDKLFEKIDNGMRAAKLVISCVTTKYAKSPNCNREVTLAVGVKKPIIPLLLENCSWPPAGSMGPIFSESLYIQFFQTGQEETNDDRYWHVDKFQELLMQLSANGMVPNEGKIDRVYRNWWIPLEETISITKRKKQSGAQNKQPAQTSSDNQSEESPDVFISYQWGKQKNIIKLYQRLTSLGFSCWLDIKQMGGGDSLYDKIDRGIRGSKVVVSCVTKKYSLSPNCRREVSLTDALKKPMVPLLLEDMTWPPSGPMSMVMTQLLYIGFQQESAHTKWEGPQFEKLVSKIREHVPTPTSEHGGSQSSSDTKDSSSPDKDASSEDRTKPHGSAMEDSKPDIAAANDKPSSETDKRPSSNDQSSPQLATADDPPPMENKTSQPGEKAQGSSKSESDSSEKKRAKEEIAATKDKPFPEQDNPPSNNVQPSAPPIESPPPAYSATAQTIESPPPEYSTVVQPTDPSPQEHSATAPPDEPQNKPHKSKCCSIS